MTTSEGRLVAPFGPLGAKRGEVIAALQAPALQAVLYIR